MKVLIIDDETVEQEQLERLLGAIPHVQIDHDRIDERVMSSPYPLKLDGISTGTDLPLQLQEAAQSKPSVSNSPLLADSRVFVRDNGRCWFVQVDEIWLLESEGNYTRLYFDGVRPMVYRPLKAFAARLAPALFFRANRHQIINLSKITHTEFNILGELVVTLCGGKRVELSRRMSRVFSEQLGV